MHNRKVLLVIRFANNKLVLHNKNKQNYGTL